MGDYDKKVMEWESKMNNISDKLSETSETKLIDMVDKNEEDELTGHYNYFYKGIKMDPYRILDIYKIQPQPQAHVIKKLLRAGNSVKDLKRDIKECIMSLNRWLEMIEEDEE